MLYSIWHVSVVLLLNAKAVIMCRCRTQSGDIRDQTKRVRKNKSALLVRLL